MRKAYSYHTVQQVTKYPDGVHRAGRLTGGYRTDGPPTPGDLIRDERDGQYYEIAQIITVVTPVEVDTT